MSNPAKAKSACYPDILLGKQDPPFVDASEIAFTPEGHYSREDLVKLYDRLIQRDSNEEIQAWDGFLCSGFIGGKDFNSQELCVSLLSYINSYRGENWGRWRYFQYFWRAVFCVSTNDIVLYLSNDMLAVEKVMCWRQNIWR